MLEIEQKYARADFAALEAKLRVLGAAGPEVHEEADHYFNAPDRDFARTGEAFRLRRIGPRNYLTFKGRRRPGALRIRTEREIPLREGDEAAQQHIELLCELGYRPVAIVSKRRAAYTLRRHDLQITVCLDEVAELGRFAEVEILAPDEQVEQARTALAELADELGLKEVAPRSYLGLLLEARATSPVARPTPTVVRTLAALREALAEVRRGGQTVGLVPTMGALHAGHLSLVQAARAQNDHVVVTIFVNPTQFGPHEDLTRYPRPFDRDLQLCGTAGVDLIYHPRAEEMYPPGFRTWVEVSGLSEVLEGSSRPGHFRGVATVVLKLLNQVRPDRAYFGQKDAQQARIIRQMVHDLDVPVEVVIGPTIREPDGLALSSRNHYLDSDQRHRASALYRALTVASQRFRAGERDPAALRRVMEEIIAATPGATLDYAEVVDADTFQPVDRADGALLLTLAVRFGATRLIDNMELRGS